MKHFKAMILIFIMGSITTPIFTKHKIVKNKALQDRENDSSSINPPLVENDLRIDISQKISSQPK